jgi:RNA polymerase sigma-70 factor (ECF subfamily)
MALHGIRADTAPFFIIVFMSNKDGFESTLVAQAQTGDERARAQILSRLEPMLRAFFIKRIGLRPEVDDLVQNTLLRVHNGLAALKDPARLKAFTMKAGVFELQDYYRGRYSMKEHLYDPDYPPSHAAGVGAAAEGVDLERALATLTPKARKVIELREYGYRYEEIAQMIGTTEAAIKMQVKRAFEKLRDVLGSVAVFLLLLGTWRLWM